MMVLTMASSIDINAFYVRPPLNLAISLAVVSVRYLEEEKTTQKVLAVSSTGNRALPERYHFHQSTASVIVAVTNDYNCSSISPLSTLQLSLRRGGYKDSC